MIASFPNAAEIGAHAKSFKIDAADITRDIARIATIAQLVESGFLNDDCVLGGGMALRLRGSNRFTIRDTDTSMRGRLDEVELTGNMTFTTDDLEVIPDGGEHWERRTKLTIAKPIRYSAYFASVNPLFPVQDTFEFTVSQRGLEEPATWVRLTTPYPELRFDGDVDVPIMDLTEHAAEKAVGWAAVSLMKHYVDLAWIGREFGATINKERFRRLVLRKLEVGAEAHPAGYENLKALKDMLVPLHRPDTYFGPLNAKKDNKAQQIRFMGNGLSLPEARALVANTIIPLLFDEKS